VEQADGRRPRSVGDLCQRQRETDRWRIVRFVRICACLLRHGFRLPVDQYFLFVQLAEELWPADGGIDSVMTDDSHEDKEMSIEEQVASQIAVLKKPRRGQRFGAQIPFRDRL
jgi:hypothetical protein